MRLLFRLLERSADVPVVSLSDDEKETAVAVDVRRSLEKQGINPDNFFAMTTSIRDHEPNEEAIQRVLEQMGLRTPEAVPDGSAAALPPHERSSGREKAEPVED